MNTEISAKTADCRNITNRLLATREAHPKFPIEKLFRLLEKIASGRAGKAGDSCSGGYLPRPARNTSPAKRSAKASASSGLAFHRHWPPTDERYCYKPSAEQFSKLTPFANEIALASSLVAAALILLRLDWGGAPYNGLATHPCRMVRPSGYRTQCSRPAQL
jgi:hypothetical protein